MEHRQREKREAGVALTGHYGLNGRNIWAKLQISDQSYMIAVADATVGEAKLEANLGAQCHLALTGVLFDFNKSILKPESDAVLQQVAAVMKKVQDLKLEVQGHTDGVGSESYNLPLSKARGHSVVVWLSDHGVAADRRAWRRQDAADRRQRHRRGPRAQPARRDRQSGLQGGEPLEQAAWRRKCENCHNSQSGRPDFSKHGP